MDVARVTKIRGKEGEYVVVDYEPVQAIKGENTQLKNVYHRGELADAYIHDKKTAQRLLRVGSERIVFMDRLLDKPDAVFECAVMPGTPDILAATQEGVAADRSATIGQE